MAKEVVVTHEGYKKLEEELDTLKTVKRSEIAEKIKVARGYGDLSENAEYDAAKEEQAVVEARIADLEATLKVARIMDDSDLSLDTVSIGMHVRILAEGCLLYTSWNGSSVAAICKNRSTSTKSRLLNTRR